MKKMARICKLSCILVALFVFISTVEISADDASTAAAANSNPEISILFIGNSLTNRHSMCKIVQRIAESKGKKIYTESFTKGGYILQQFYNEREYVSRFNSRKWDCVVLQDSAYMPFNKQNRYDYIRLFDKEIKNINAKTALFIHNTIDVQNMTLTYSQEKPLIDAYTEIGNELGSLVVPAGVAWVDFSIKYPDIKLYDPDNIHPTIVGAYLTACVFYSSFFGESPVGGSTEDLKNSGYEELGEAIQKIAWDSTCNYYSNNPSLRAYLIPPPTPTPTPQPSLDTLRAMIREFVPAPTPTQTPTPTPTPTPAATAKNASISSSILKIDNNKSTISIGKASMPLFTFKYNIALPKKALLIILKENSNISVVTGNVLPGMKVVVIAENETNCRVYTITK